jgi:carbamoyl-phosphate synthase small subunit
MTYENWQPGVLILDDGTVLKGEMPFKIKVSGEICFNTGMTGYQEAISDPSYTDQIITFTFPYIGNVGFNQYDNENGSFSHQLKTAAKGIIIRNKVTNSSNFRSEGNFIEFAKGKGIAIISEIDTRSLAGKIRKKLVSNCIISSYETNSDIEKLVSEVKSLPSMQGMELAKNASSKKFEEYLPNGNENTVKTVVVIDYGIKENILRILKQKNLRVIVAPCDANFEEIIKYNPSGILLSNGPGDPSETFKYTAKTISELAKANIPIFGICLGHQLIAKLFGGKLIKLPQGHRGINHPVINYETGIIEITPQNHGFACVDEDLPNHIEVTHRSLFDSVIEGIKIKKGVNLNIEGLNFTTGEIFAVQYHPEGSSGPHDSQYLFDKFISVLK